MTHHEKKAAASMSTASNDRTVVVTRVFDAPRDAVYKAWTDPKLMSQWWAPETLTVPKAEMDVRPGGRYRIVMRDEDGNDYPSTGEYREVVSNERIVYTDSSDEMPSAFMDQFNEARGEAPGTPVHDGIVTVTFADAGSGKTKLTFSAEYDSKKTADAWKKMQMVEGLQGGFDHLERVLAEMGTPAR